MENSPFIWLFKSWSSSSPTHLISPSSRTCNQINGMNRLHSIALDKTVSEYPWFLDYSMPCNQRWLMLIHRVITEGDVRGSGPKSLLEYEKCTFRSHFKLEKHGNWRCFRLSQAKRRTCTRSSIHSNTSVSAVFCPSHRGLKSPTGHTCDINSNIVFITQASILYCIIYFFTEAFI